MKKGPMIALTAICVLACLVGNSWSRPGQRFAERRQARQERRQNKVVHLGLQQEAIVAPAATFPAQPPVTAPPRKKAEVPNPPLKPAGTVQTLPCKGGADCDCQQIVRADTAREEVLAAAPQETPAPLPVMMQAPVYYGTQFYGGGACANGSCSGGGTGRVGFFRRR